MEEIAPGSAALESSPLAVDSTVGASVAPLSARCAATGCEFSVSETIALVTAGFAAGRTRAGDGVATVAAAAGAAAEATGFGEEAGEKAGWFDDAATELDAGETLGPRTDESEGAEGSGFGVACDADEGEAEACMAACDRKKKVPAVTATARQAAHAPIKTQL